MEWADRIMFATDIGTWETDQETANNIQSYFNAFRILESDGLVQGSFFGDKQVEGLNLPKDVLEKIYYKNAMRIYPGLREQMVKLQYVID